jgi:hypothetical protein
VNVKTRFRPNAPRQIPYHPLTAVVGVRELAATAGAFQLPVAALPSDPRSSVLFFSSMSCRSEPYPPRGSAEGNFSGLVFSTPIQADGSF